MGSQAQGSGRGLLQVQTIGDAMSTDNFSMVTLSKPQSAFYYHHALPIQNSVIKYSSPKIPFITLNSKQLEFCQTILSNKQFDRLYSSGSQPGRREPQVENR